MSTPHINAEKGDFAETVLMPGDPYRAEFIAKNFLDGARLVNDVRAVRGYTGTYRGKPVSVMASGMGMPSIGIYSYELFNFFDVDNIIRIGSAGSYSENVKLRDIVIAEGACTDSNYAGQFGLPGTFAPISDFGILRKTVETAEKTGLFRTPSGCTAVPAKPALSVGPRWKAAASRGGPPFFARTVSLPDIRSYNPFTRPQGLKNAEDDLPVAG